MTTSHTNTIDLAFQLTGQSLPADHGFALYGAISRLLPTVHDVNGIAIHPIRGRIVGDRTMQLTDASRLIIRAASERIAELLPLAGKQLIVAGHTLRIGVPQVFALTPSTAVRSRLVVIGDEHRKGSHCEELARIEKGATVTQPTFSLWRGYSKAKGGAKDVDGARLRTHSQKTL